MAPRWKQNAVVLTLLALVVLSFGNPGEETELVRSEQEMRWLYEEWVLNNDKSYSDESEKAKRFEIFKENLRFIDDHNRPGNNHTYSVGLNQFADLNDDEFRSLYLGPPLNLSDIPSAPISKLDKPKKGQHLPAAIDWRRWGAVSAVKNQGVCESCRAFAAVAAIEGLQKITTGRLITLSEQELVDCDKRNKGCKAGVIDLSYQYIVENGGIDTDWHYPYRGVAGHCRADRKRVTRIAGYRQVPSNDPYALQSAVARQPVSVWIEAYGRGFRFYRSGVFTGPCGTAGDHFVAVIGYGMDQRGYPYWLLKNSWGMGWGEAGFMRILRQNVRGSGLCAILMHAQYPVMSRWVGQSTE